MPNPLPTPEPMVLRPSDFDPPLKRKEPTIPWYWTIDEIAAELGVTSRRVRYDITGLPSRKIEPNLKAYKAGHLFLVPDDEALHYIQRFQERKKS
jgi:hypothetical protein